MQGHVQRDDAFPLARLPENGTSGGRPPVEHRHGQQQRDKGHARERIKKEVAGEQKRPVFPVPRRAAASPRQGRTGKGCELQRDEIHQCLSGQKVMRKGARFPHNSENARPLQATASRLGYPLRNAGVFNISSRQQQEHRAPVVQITGRVRRRFAVAAEQIHTVALDRPARILRQGQRIERDAVLAPSSGSVTFISVSRPLGKTLWSVATLTHGVIRSPYCLWNPKSPACRA